MRRIHDFVHKYNYANNNHKMTSSFETIFLSLTSYRKERNIEVNLTLINTS